MKRMLDNRTGRSAVYMILLLAVLVCFSVPALAVDSGTCGEGLTWTRSGSKLTISGSGAMYDYSDDNMPPWFENRLGIASVTVGEGVTRIGTLAFFGLENLTRVSLPSTVTMIGDSSFKNCAKLTYINLPQELARISDSAFENCTSLNGIRLPDGLTWIGDFALYRCASLTYIRVPASVAHLGAAVFAFCTSLVEAKILCAISVVPEWTFYGCTSLSSLTLPETVEALGTSVFYQCDNLIHIYYDGTAAEEIVASVSEESERTEDTIIIGSTETGADLGVVVTYDTTDDGANQSEMTVVSATDDSIITVSTTNEQTFTLDGEPASNEEVLAAVEAAGETGESIPVNENTYGVVTTGIGISTETTSTVDAVIENSEGWTELTEAVKDATDNHTGEDNVQVTVQIPGTTVAGQDLKKTAGKDIDLSITTSEGTTWVIDQSGQRKGNYSNDIYDLGITVRELSGSGAPKIESELLYSLRFSGTTDFKTTVGVPLSVGDARMIATLYQKDGKEYKAIQTVIVDDSGVAWFQLSQTDAKTEYYVALNAAGVDANEAIIPATLAKDYGLDSTLTGMDGKQYQITGRTSRWGITGAQFALYAAIGIAAIVLIVTLVMVTRNRLARSKARFAAGGAEEAPIDEEALRLEIMRDLLNEQEHKDT